MKSFKSMIQEARRKLEGLSIEEQEDVTLFVTEIQEMNRVLERWENQLRQLKAGRKLLYNNRYNWPADWLWIDVVESEWSAFTQILSKRTSVMQEQIPTL